MDVTRSDFNAKLPFVLEDIACSNFIAIDLELSGIPGQQINKSRRDGQESHGLPTLQERYMDIKRAAEKYQVLQLGITCAFADHGEGKYVLKPYNFFLNPLPDSRLDIERTISYQSGAVEFLLGHGFRMEAPYLQGVPYLSRDEEKVARLARKARFTMPDIDIKETDVESIRFLQTLRDSIGIWKTGRELQSGDFLNIPPPDKATTQQYDRGLNGFQKRLVHQFVRTFHPDLVTISRPGFIQIVPFDKLREDANQARRDRTFEQQLEAQIGLRWPVEAMAGGQLANLTTSSFLHYVQGREEEVAKSVIELKATLKTRRTVLVGHNVFMDLVYFYRSFFGQLPDRVEDFQRIIHGLFPLVIDTKYLATRDNVNPVMAKSSLEELDDQCKAQQFPLIETAESHEKYRFEKPAHEAGYDSFLTAKVLIRLSAKLEAEGQYSDYHSSDEGYHTPPDYSGEVHHLSQKAMSPPKKGVPALPEDGGVPIKAEDDSDPSSISSNSLNGKHEKKKAKKPTKFSHAGKYDLLDDLDHDLLDMSISRDQDPKQREGLQTNEFTMIPPFESHFWVVYGNKLRVNGTLEGLCDVSAEGMN